MSQPASGGLAGSPFYEKGRLFFAARDYDGAGMMRDLLDARKPGHWEVAMLDGFLAEGNRRALDALEHFRKAAELHPPIAPEALARAAGCLTTLNRFDEAAALAQQSIDLAPNAWEGPFQLGNALYLDRRADAALPYAEQANAASGGTEPTLNLLALIYREEGRLAEAEAAWRQVLGLKATSEAALIGLSSIALVRHQFDAGAELLRDALATLDTDPLSLARLTGSLCQILSLRRQHEAAVTACQWCLQRIAAAPDSAGRRTAETLMDTTLAALAVFAGHFAEANAWADKADALTPTGEGVHELLQVMNALGRRQDMLRIARRSAETLIEDLDAWTRLASFAINMAAWDEATYALERLTAISPTDRRTLSHQALYAYKTGNPLAAYGVYQQCIELHGEDIESLSNLAVLLRMANRIDEALEMCERASALGSSHPGFFSNYGICLLEMLRPREAVQMAIAAVRADDRGGKVAQPFIVSNFNYAVLYDEEADAEERRQAAQIYDRLLGPREPDPLRPHLNMRDPHKRLKIGLISGDFRRHSVAFFVEALLNGHDRDTTEYILYSNYPRPDKVTERLIAAADGYLLIDSLTDDEVTERIYDDGVDILIDLAGHSAYSSLPVFVRRPAPIQVTWLGYPATTGVSDFDARLVDSHTDPLPPPGGPEGDWHSEPLVRMDPCFLAFHPDPSTPPPGPTPALANGYITFGSFNTAHKINRPLLKIWAEVLLAVPKSRLFLKARHFGRPATAASLLQTLESFGVSPDRVTVIGFAEEIGHHLKLYERIDIALDTFPYTGTTTTCEALMMGVPVLTLAGHNHLSRVGVSLVSALGLGETLVARDVADYVAKAAHLASDPERLARLRVEVAERFQASPLRDETGFARRFEATLRGLWAKWCARMEPSTLRRVRNPTSLDASIE